MKPWESPQNFLVECVLHIHGIGRKFMGLVWDSSLIILIIILHHYHHHYPWSDSGRNIAFHHLTYTNVPFRSQLVSRRADTFKAAICVHADPASAQQWVLFALVDICRATWNVVDFSLQLGFPNNGVVLVPGTTVLPTEIHHKAETHPKINRVVNPGFTWAQMDLGLHFGKQQLLLWPQQNAKHNIRRK